MSAVGYSKSGYGDCAHGIEVRADETVGGGCAISSWLANSAYVVARIRQSGRLSRGVSLQSGKCLSFAFTRIFEAVCEFVECLGFDLADSLSCEAELLADFLEGVWLSTTQAET